MHDKPVVESQFIDDLSPDYALLAISRELLRAIGLTGMQWIVLDAEHSGRTAIDRTSLAILRSLLTLVSTPEPDENFFALNFLRSTVSQKAILGHALPEQQDMDRVVDVIEICLASKCANAFSATKDSDEFLGEAIDKMHRILRAPKSVFLRYARDDIIIEVPPADQTHNVPLWANEEALADDPKGWIMNNQPTELLVPKLLDESIGNWSFWRDWYQGFLDGKPLDWELQRRVALIPDADWEKGPEHIAEKIEDIRARFDLEQRIKDLEEEIITASTQRLGIGGNNPPEPIDAPIAKEFMVIWSPLQDLKEEAEKETPAPGLIKRAIKALGIGLSLGLKWLAKKADIIVDTAIKWAIPAAGGGYLALNPDKITQVIEAAKTLLNTLP